MKFYDSHFEDYLNSHDRISLHPKLTKLYNTFPPSIDNLKNMIFYGPKGVGKYTQMLASIRKYSPTNLKYEKKISVSYNKNIYFLKLSDIHFEVDMSLLGCNSKMLWNEIYNHIIDAIFAKSQNTGIIVCKYFHEIHSELLETFYSYMQTMTNIKIDLKFILLTEEISFIPDNILNCCYLITVPRPTRSAYNLCLKHKIKKDIQLNEITNIKNLQASVTQLIRSHEIICMKIIDAIIDIENTKLISIRDSLYDIFIYNLDITDCIWFILEYMIDKKYLKDKDISDVLYKTFTFFQYYNNNYRPIYHLESYIFYITNKVHGFGTSM